MKKSKLSLCLASSFVAALSLVACSSVSSKDGAVVTVKDYDGDEVTILTDAAYRKYKSETDGVSKFYNAILESLIRYEYQNPESGIRKSQWSKAIKSNAEIQSEAENNVKNDKNTAEENAKTNDTSYETEWDAILESHNCEDEDDLLEYYIYQLEKEDITDKFFIQQRDSSLTTEWLGVTDDGKDPNDGDKANGVFPYHIRHVLTSISGGSTNFYDGTITSEEAKNLGNTIDALTDSKFTFADVAKKYSGDTGSGEKGGDVGIMSTTTSFVNEFKLGIYAYDAIYTNRNKDQEFIEKGLGINDDYKLDLFGIEDGIGIKSAWTYSGTGSFNKGEIQTVPYGAFKLIGSLAEQEKDAKNKLVNDGNEHYYPRNVLYNYYLNFHNPFIITNERIYGSNETDDRTSNDFGFGVIDTTVDAKRFQVDLGSGKKALTDEDGNIIIGCRSEHGIHFMIMEKSIYDYKESKDTVDGASLEEYYTTLTKNDSDFPSTSKGEPKNTYVSYITTSDNSVYTTRANEIKTAVQSFDTTYDYRLYNYILEIEGDNIKINDKDLAEAIDQYISRTRVANNDNAEKTLNEAWRTYTELVALQYDNRTEYDGSERYAPATFRSISPRCAVGFKNRNTSTETEWKDGGLCYYEK